MLRTKCILSTPVPEDGERDSVMNRHTLTDGKTPDKRITPQQYAGGWLKELAPPSELLGDYYKRGMPWAEYEQRYISFLRTSEPAQAVKKLARRALEKDITLLCIEEDAAYCHRRPLAEECQRYEPSLRVGHL